MAKGPSAKVGSIVVDFAMSLANIEKDTKKATATLQSFERSIKGISGNIEDALGFAKGVVGFELLKKGCEELISAVNELAERGDKVSDLQEAFSTLGGSQGAINSARDATKGLITDTNLLAAANKGLISGIKDLDKAFPKIAGYAAQYAEATGGDVKETLDKMMAGLSAGKAKGLKEFGFQIDPSIKDKAEVVRIALEQLTGLMERIPEIGPSAANSLTSVMTAGTGMVDSLAVGVNASDDLRMAYDEMAKVIRGLDWETVGTSIAGVASVIVNSLSWWIDKVDALNAAVEGFKDNNPNVAAVRNLDEIEMLQKRIDRSKSGEWIDPGRGRTLEQALAAYQKRIDELQAQNASNGFNKRGTMVEGRTDLLNRDDAAEKLKETEKQRQATAQAAADKREQDAKDKEAAREAKASAKEITREAERIAKAYDDAQASLNKMSLDSVVRDMESTVSSAIESGASDADFSVAVENFKKAFQTKFIVDKINPAIAANPNLQGGLVDQAAIAANAAAAKLNAERADYAEKEKLALEQHVKDLKQVGREWATVLQDAFTVSAVDWKKNIKEQMFGAAGSFISGLTNGKGVDSWQQIGETVGLKLGEYMAGSLAEFESMTQEQKDQFSKDMANYIQAAVTVISAIVNAKATDSANKDNSGTGGAVGAGIGAVVGGIYGGPAGAAMGASIGQMVGGMIGSIFKWGSQNPDTKARHAFANWMEDQFSKLVTYATMNSSGQMQVIKPDGEYNFIEGDRSRFNDGSWATEMNSWGAGVSDMFAGLGNALKNLLGLTEEVGTQIGYLLAQNIGANIDAARLLVFQLGLSFEDLKKGLLASAESGEIRWSEFNQQIAGLGEAFKPGLAAVGDINAAMNNLIGSGGRGLGAVKSLLDLAQEGIEKGFSTVDQLGQYLLTQGYSKEYVDALMTALKQQGIATLDAMKGLSNEQAGSIVGNMEANSKGLQEEWAKMGEAIDDINKKLDELADKKVEAYVDVKANIDPELIKLIESGIMNGGSTQAGAVTGDTGSTTKKFGFGGLVSMPTYIPGNQMIGDRGMEAVMPVTSVGGKLGVSAIGLDSKRQGNSNVTFVINAQNSAPGVENAIMSAIQDIEQNLIDGAVSAVVNMARNGDL